MSLNKFLFFGTCHENSVLRNLRFFKNSYFGSHHENSSSNSFSIFFRLKKITVVIFIDFSRIFLFFLNFPLIFPFFRFFLHFPDSLPAPKMSSDDYESIDTPRVASLSDLSRRLKKPSEYSTDDDDDVTPTKNVILAPLEHVFKKSGATGHDSEDGPRIQMREKRIQPRIQEATVSQYVEEQKFKRRSAERHSMLAGAADFASRRSPFGNGNGGSGRWTDLFTSNRFKRKHRQKLNVRGILKDSEWFQNF